MVNTGKELLIKDIRLEDLAGVAKQIISFADKVKVWILEGEMGSGKTTLIKALCQELGSGDVVTSPTFALVNEYYSEKGTLFHFDFYRVNSLAEAQEAGVEEYFYSGDYCFIEWPDIVNPILPEQILKISIDVKSDGLRSYKLSQNDFD